MVFSFVSFVCLLGLMMMMMMIISFFLTRLYVNKVNEKNRQKPAWKDEDNRDEDEEEETEEGGQMRWKPDAGRQAFFLTSCSFHSLISCSFPFLLFSFL